MNPDTTPQVRRRGLLAALGVTGLVAGMAPSTRAASAPLQLTAATTEGPYYFDPNKIRPDITEGLAGVPLDLRFTILDAQGQPLGGLRVDVWHCDAQGRYSGYAGQGDDRRLSTKEETFLRGSQPTDREGVAAFKTLYPGWYAGRTTHIHLKVLNGSRAVLTSQFFLPDALSEFLYTQLPQYRRARLRDTLNSTDGIALEAGGSVIGAVREDRDRYIATLTLVVDPASHPEVDRPPVAGERPPGGPGEPGGRGGPGGPGPGGVEPGGPRRPVPHGDARVQALVPGFR